MNKRPVDESETAEIRTKIEKHIEEPLKKEIHTGYSREIEHFLYRYGCSSIKDFYFLPKIEERFYCLIFATMKISPGRDYCFL